jgi:hypothetical protein
MLSNLLLTATAGLVRPTLPLAWSRSVVGAVLPTSRFFSGQFSKTPFVARFPHSNLLPLGGGMLFIRCLVFTCNE